MRVDELGMEFDLEVQSIQLSKSILLDGIRAESARTAEGTRVLFNPSAQMLLVVTKRGEQHLLPFAQCQVKLKQGPPTAKDVAELAELTAARAIAGGLHDAADVALKAAAERVSKDRAKASAKK